MRCAKGTNLQLKARKHNKTGKGGRGGRGGGGGVEGGRGGGGGRRRGGIQPDCTFRIQVSRMRQKHRRGRVDP